MKSFHILRCLPFCFSWSVTLTMAYWGKKDTRRGTLTFIEWLWAGMGWHQEEVSPSPTLRSSHMTLQSPSFPRARNANLRSSLSLHLPWVEGTSLFLLIFLQRFICSVFPAPHCFHVNGERRMRRMRRKKSCSQVLWGQEMKVTAAVPPNPHFFSVCPNYKLCSLVPFSLMGSADVNCLFIWGKGFWPLGNSFWAYKAGIVAGSYP